MRTFATSESFPIAETARRSSFRALRRRRRSIDLKGKKVGVAKGSSAHNLLVTALESADIAWSDIMPVYLAPADAASAFARGSIDAWSIWDPFYAIAELRMPARCQSTRKQSRKTASSSPIATSSLPTPTSSLRSTKHCGGHDLGRRGRDETCKLFSEASEVEIAAEKRSVDREEFTFAAIGDKVIAEQQAVADRFQRLGLIPARVNVRDIVWDGKWGS